MYGSAVAPVGIRSAFDADRPADSNALSG